MRRAGQQSDRTPEAWDDRLAAVDGIGDVVRLMIELLQEDPFAQRLSGLPLQEHPPCRDTLGMALLGMLCFAVHRAWLCSPVLHSTVLLGLIMSMYACDTALFFVKLCAVLCCAVLCCAVVVLSLCC